MCRTTAVRAKPRAGWSELVASASELYTPENTSQ